MRRFLSIALALCVGLTLSLDVNAAKRMGGGKSFGSAPTHQTRQAAPAQQTPNTAAPAAASDPCTKPRRVITRPERDFALMGNLG